jgi:hypothetical protein
VSYWDNGKFVNIEVSSTSSFENESLSTSSRDLGDVSEIEIANRSLSINQEENPSVIAGVIAEPSGLGDSVNISGRTDAQKMKSGTLFACLYLS